MRFSAFLATAAFITPAVIAASGKGHHGTTHRQKDRGLGIAQLDIADGLVKVKDVELGQLHRRDEDMPGYTDGKNDGIMEPSPNAELANPNGQVQGSNTNPTATEPENSNEDDMLDPSAMPSGSEAGYPGTRSYIRSRALHTRQEDYDEDDDSSYAEKPCDPDNEDCDREAYAEDDDEEPDSDNAKYLARVKRAREQHLKAKRAVNHNLKQASRRDVVERSRLGRRTGSRPSASPRPPT